MAERIWQGLPASPGLAIGPLARLPEHAAALGATKVGDPPAERARLEAAIATAMAELEALIATADGLGAEILAFQLEMLGDPELTREAHAAIAGGTPAVTAWKTAMAAQRAEFEASEDELFRARASDLADLSGRVTTVLGGGGAALHLPRGAILLARDLAPSQFLSLDWRALAGAALADGSPTAHTSILARARGVPLVTSLGGLPEPVSDAVLDAEAGLLVTEPDAATREAVGRRLHQRRAAAARAARAMTAPARTAEGEPVEVMINIDRPDAVDPAVLAAADGVGLFRTEFLFIGRDRLPDEAEQYTAYRAMLDGLQGRPCIIRTVDVGGDKPLPGVSMPAETNPFLGLRGLRLCLERPELFRPQVRALLRAADGSPALKVMLPMVTTAEEVARARAVFRLSLAELQRAGLPAAMPPLGIMVEVPAAAIAIDLLDADFYSIGSNDLTQYVMAASREQSGAVAALADPLHPAVLRLVRHVVEHGSATGRPVSLCGDIASEPRAIPALLDAGLRRFSVAAAALGRVKEAVGLYRGREA